MSGADIFNHLKYVHNINSGTAMHITCPECNCTFSHCKSYKKHVRNVHLKSTAKNVHATYNFDLAYIQEQSEEEEDHICETEDDFEVRNGKSLGNDHNPTDKWLYFWQVQRQSQYQHHPSR